MTQSSVPVRLSWPGDAGLSIPGANIVSWSEQSEQDPTARMPHYADNWTTSCAVTSSGQYSHTTQKEHILSEFQGNQRLCERNPPKGQNGKKSQKQELGSFEH